MHITEIALLVFLSAFIVAFVEEIVEYIKRKRPLK